MSGLPTAQELVRDYRLWLLHQAAMLLPGRQAEWPDLAQEGHIAMWRALQAYDPAKGALPSWLTSRARYRMAECVQRRTWTGKPAVRDGRNAVPPAPEPLPLDDEILEQAGLDVLDGVAAAYHHGEIVRVLNGLPPGAREAVFRRFWLDEPSVSGYWRRIIPVLRERLDHLRDCC